MNKIVICGRLARDSELRTTNSGLEVCNFTVAVERRRQKGEEKVADFIDCTAWGKAGAFVNTYFHVGDGITVEGRLESRKWADNDGKNRVSWAITCDNIEFPLGKGRGESHIPAQPEFSEVKSDDKKLPF